MNELTPAQRLIVAADFRPTEPDVDGAWAENQVLELADKLQGTGVCLKVNSALRAAGYQLISKIKARGLQVFADLKLFDIGNTLATDAALLKPWAPELLTVSCTAGEAMQALAAALPNTEVLGVTVLTNRTDGETEALYGMPVIDLVRKYGLDAITSGLDGLISSPKEVTMLSRLLAENNATRMTLNTPGVRPEWSQVQGDDQNPDRVMTPADAIRAGATRIVIGRPIVQAENPLEAVQKTIAEIETALG